MAMSPRLVATSLVLLALAACSSEADSPDIAAEPTVDAAAPPLPPPPPPPAPTLIDAGFDAGPKTCLETLTARGIQFTTTTARGIVDAVKVTSAIRGIRFTREDTDTLATDPMACSFVLTLDRFAEVLAKYDVVQVGTLGSYCYRCCCAWSPSNDCRSPSDAEPNCGQNGYSNHSWGRAVDVRYLKFKSGAVYDINDGNDWLIGSSSGTCSTGLSKQKGASKTLYSIACDTAAALVFKNILTPNYNEAHRNHWHMDIGDKGDDVAGSKVRSLTGWGIDEGEHADACGGH